MAAPNYLKGPEKRLILDISRWHGLKPIDTVSAFEFCSPHSSAISHKCASVRLVHESLVFLLRYTSHAACKADSSVNNEKKETAPTEPAWQINKLANVRIKVWINDGNTNLLLQSNLWMESHGQSFRLFWRFPHFTMTNCGNMDGHQRCSFAKSVPSHLPLILFLLWALQLKRHFWPLCGWVQRCQAADDDATNHGRVGTHADSRRLHYE